jgi:hypothetical protein
VLIALYTFFFAPVSGFSINPARTIGSAFFAGVWTAGWLYFAAPLLGMFSAAEVYARINGGGRVLCAKLHPDPAFPCPFVCHFPGHRHMLDPHAEDPDRRPIEPISRGGIRVSPQVLQRCFRSSNILAVFQQYCYVPKHTIGEQLLQVREAKREQAAYDSATLLDR